MYIILMYARLRFRLSRLVAVSITILFILQQYNKLRKLTYDNHEKILRRLKLWSSVNLTTLLVIILWQILWSFVN